MKHTFYILFIIILVACSDEKDEQIMGFELDKSEISLRIDEEASLNAVNFRPDIPEVYNAQWISSDTNIVKVDNGVVRGNAYGSTYVHAEIDGVRSPSCKVTVRGILDEDNDVFIAGSNDNSAVYWKNGIAVELTDGKFKASGNAFLKDGDDIYVAGYEETSSGTRNAKYWKNGEATLLSEKQSYAVDIAVEGGNVYVVGNRLNDDGTAYTVTLWTNGEAEVLSDESQFAQATSIHLDNGNVYVSGYAIVWQNDEAISVPQYWKNGEQIILDPQGLSHVNDIKVHNGEVYILGHEWIDDVSSVKYWKGDEEVYLSSNGDPGYGLSLSIENDDIYASGFVFDVALNYISPAYWKNGIIKRFPQDELYGEVSDITSSNGDVYFIANVIHNGEYRTTKYWKNDREIIFLDWSDNSFARDIVVVAK